MFPRMKKNNSTKMQFLDTLMTQNLSEMSGEIGVLRFR